MRRVADTTPPKYSFAVAFDGHYSDLTEGPTTNGWLSRGYANLLVLEIKHVILRNQTEKFWKSKTQLGNQTDKFWKSKTHFRNQTDKFWKSKVSFEKSNGQILEIKNLF